MKLLYYLGRTANFGDDLNAELWPALAPELFERDDGAAFVGVGTIIGMNCDAALRLNVFSSGVGNDDARGWSAHETRYWCVRGPISRKILGLDEDSAITDGAILAPLTPGFPKRAADPEGVVVIPHWQTLDFPGWPEVARMTGYEVLDPRASTKAVLGRIARARMVLTESLHGAIFADLYGIPWLAFATSRNFGVAKWIDWSRSLGRPFTVTMIAAPDPSVVAVHGRRPEPLDRPQVFDLDDALGELEVRLAPPVRSTPRMRQQIKAALARSTVAGRLLGYTPERTGAALTRLARAEPTLTPTAVIESLQSRMVERLEAVRAEHRRS